MWQRVWRLAGLLFAVVLSVDCAHPISIAPKVESLVRASDGPEKISKKVGYFIPAESLNLEVTTPGGGGDNVRYFPYRDLEAGYVAMLNTVFASVIRVIDPTDISELQRGGLDYVLSPEMVTNSGSTGFFTWPPTNFTIDLTTKVRDISGSLVHSMRVIGVASVGGIGDMDGNHGLTGQLAMLDALRKKQAALMEIFSGGKPQAVPASKDRTDQPQGSESTEIRLTKLKELLDKKLISETDYITKKAEILRGL